MDSMLKIDTIHQLHELAGYSPPEHPLISLIEIDKIKAPQTYEQVKLRLGFFCISMKGEIEDNITYGRQSYDFQEGSMVYMAPNQVLTLDLVSSYADSEGWILSIHPDLLRGTALADKMEKCNFFSYNTNESLHISDTEKQQMNTIIEAVRSEFSQNQDQFSRTLMLSNIDLLLNYSERFYKRQFHTRESFSTDVIRDFESLMKNRFALDTLELQGIPAVGDLSKEMGYSTYYLSDLLKKETGKSTQDYIHEYLLERAKDLLLSTDEPASKIGYRLGFEYPTHFSKFFKSKVGLTPGNYRKVK